jgi:hypothetical protein
MKFVTDGMIDRYKQSKDYLSKEIMKISGKV